MGHYSNSRYSSVGYTRKCDECGRQHHIGKQYSYHFMTMDGGDSISQDICWLCDVKGSIYGAKTAVKRFFKRIAFVADLASMKPSLRRVRKYWKVSKGMHL